jgi:hypothetical protein
MPWGVAAAAVVGLYSANKQSQAGKAGAAAQTAASQYATDEQRREYDQSRQDQLPFLQAGQDALGRQAAFLNGDWSGFENSPDYKFALDQGLKLSDRSAAARGSLFSGGHSADLMQLGQGLATQNADNYWNKLAGRAGQGQVTAQNLGQLGASMATNIGNNAMNGANARASSYANTANAYGNFGNQLVGAIGQYYGSRNTNMNTYGGNPYGNYYGSVG